MRQYLDLMQHVLENGSEKTDRTGTGTLSVFGYQMRFDLSQGFPLITTKKLHLHSIIHELLWFLQGDTNIRYLKENSVREGVVVLDSGLQYRIVKPGAGGSPTETDTVVVHYRGRLLNGSEFDSSYVRGQPAELGVGQVIPGWQQALQLMPVGSTWEIWIPAALAYGAQGAGSIGPNETLHFDIELLEIKG